MRRAFVLIAFAATGWVFAQPSALNPDPQAPRPIEALDTVFIEEMTWMEVRDALKAGNEDVQVRSDWTIPLCTGEERLKGRDGKKLQPTQKPEALLARVILSSSRPDDLVLDPFNGTGTTGAVARHLGRRYVGFERDEKYAQAARKRIAAVEPLEAPTLAPFMTARDAPRVPFQALIEKGLVSAGAKLVDAKKRHKALVRADGAISLGEKVGSIHRIGAPSPGMLDRKRQRQISRVPAPSGSSTASPRWSFMIGMPPRTTR